jgi:uncharacterized membrane protein
MDGTAVVLVLLSAGAHAGWNFLTKRSTWPLGFTWAIATVGTLALLPVGAVLLVQDLPGREGWMFAGISWLVHLAYFRTLARGYSEGDLSVVYPIARGTGVTLVPIFGIVFLSETMSHTAVVGVTGIVAGIVVLGATGLAGARFRPAGVEFALLTGLLIATYSVVDARGVDEMNPLLYLTIIGTSGTVGLLPAVLANGGAPAARNIWRTGTAAVIAAGVLQVAAYGTILWVLQESRVAYVAPLREVALVFGVVLGAVFLGERAAGQRVLGAAIILVGAVAIALAP